ncbi:UDP-N-acetylglucosamine 1-carboxyvinyltransferase-like, partial [Drosophila ananassae]|uniref:UDP-N-acetylglucosamine 1-carboxyvinyltransferase-like n=1 Tax=Drosophila ananassae TaxID=7217 RepID=UPI001CFF8447
GSKNAVLPIMAASLLSSSPVILHNVPDLIDVHLMSKLLESLGAEVNFMHNKNYKANHTLKIDCSNINNHVMPYKTASKLRTSFLILGPMLSRFGKARTAFPGGCNIGKRPVDMHIKALEEMGAKIEIDGYNIIATVKGKLQGKEITFEKISVGATENVIMAATFAEGVTTINNAATEPEVLDLIDFLKKMGADIEIDNTKVVITGVEALNGCVHKIIPDRIEAGTYALAAIDGISVIEENIFENRFTHADELRKLGANISIEKSKATISGIKSLSGANLYATDLRSTAALV